MAKQKIKVEQDLEKKIPISLLATSILETSEGMKKLLNGGLKLDTIVVLIHDHTRIGKGDIKRVLESLGQLEETYINKRKPG